jgi:copper chaperone
MVRTGKIPTADGLKPLLCYRKQTACPSVFPFYMLIFAIFKALWIIAASQPLGRKGKAGPAPKSWAGGELRRCRLTRRGLTFAAARASIEMSNRGSTMTTFSIPDMSCGHCKAAVEAALTAVPGAGPISVDLAAKRATAEGAADPTALLAALSAAGYPATTLPA